MKLTLILVLVFIFTACYQIDRPKEPKNLISKQKMVAILVDASLINSAKSVNKKRLENNGIVPDQYLYKIHGVDSATFAKSNDYYAYQIKEYEEIYLKVKDSLENLKKKYNAILDKENAVKDSTKRIKLKLKQS